MRNWLQISHISAGFMVVLIGYASSAVIVFQAAATVGATTAEMSSWLWALGIGTGITCIGLSWYYRMPLLLAWSTPGAALMVTSLSGFTMADAIGAFLFSSFLTVMCGLTGWFERLMRWLPATLSAAMLAGVLTRFGLNIFAAMPEHLLLVSVMLVSFIICRSLWSRYAVLLTFIVGILLVAVQGELHFTGFNWSLAQPVLMMPHFSLLALISIGVPLFIVTMASQNLPGLAMLRAHGYQAPVSSLITWSGVIGLLFASFGGFAFCMAAITAAICMNKDVDVDPQRRYLASMWAGGFYLLAGMFGAAIVGLFSVFPPALVATIAGVALLNTIGHNLMFALHNEVEREAALLTFLVTVSGMNLFGVSSAFWGLIFGLITHLIQRVTLQVDNGKK